jgi:hypothetical protein
MSKRKAEVPSREPGAPSLYDPAICALVTDYCLLGAKNEEISRLLSISEATFADWFRDKPDFREAVQAGRAVADAAVAKSLYHRAKGYSCPKTVVHVIGGQIVRTEIIEHYPPDTAAAFIWLQNRRRDDWKQRQADGAEAQPDEIAALAQDAIRRAMATTEG